jgi:redox-sensitive bicupin YhaK (pirin superfamily)
MIRRHSLPRAVSISGRPSSAPCRPTTPSGSTRSARLALTRLSAGKTLRYDIIFPGNGVYVFVLSGSVEIGDSQLQSRDGLGITDADHFSVHAVTDAEILAIEVPMFCQGLAPP